MAISHCGFLDLGYCGSPFTWSRNHPTEGRIRIHLDRALAIAAWKSKFPGALVQHLSMSTSDHSMIVVSTPSTKPRYKRPRPPFRFEAMWLRDPRCAEIVEDAWMEGLYQPNGAQIRNCLDSCRTRLSAWNKTEFGHVGRQISRLEKELQMLEQHHRPNHKHIEEVRKALNCWLDAENTMWHQRSRHLWITDGDRNTSFFHQKASNRKDRNLIRGITDQNGVWQEDDQAVESIVLDYFNSIFRSNGPTDIAPITATVRPMVTDQMNEYLCQTFQADEVHKALKQMHPKKSPGPDGMPPLFYQHFWSLTGECVTKAVLDFLNLGVIPPKFNDTHIILIPKVKNPTKITQYRPISLSNVISRLASKVIANRLKRFLPDIISENQSAFMSTHLITDNVLVAFETMHHLNQKRSGRVGEMALKLDMSKALIEWNGAAFMI